MRIYRLVRPHAGVCVKQAAPAAQKFSITDELGTALTGVRADTLLLELDEEKTKILGADNKQLSPSGRFFITAETHYPFHVILDIMDFTAVTCIRYQ